MPPKNPSTPTSGTGPRDDKSASEIAKDAKSTAEGRAAGATDKVKAEAHKASDKAKAEAHKMSDEARSMAGEQFDHGKKYASSNIDETAENIRNAGREFGDDSYQAQAADYLASNLSHAADVIRRQDIGSFTDDISNFARRNPAVFLGGAALLGFAAARLMKASERHDDPMHGDMPVRRGGAMRQDPTRMGPRTDPRTGLASDVESDLETGPRTGATHVRPGGSGGNL